MRSTSGWRWAALLLPAVLAGCATPPAPQAPARTGKPAPAQPVAQAVAQPASPPPTEARAAEPAEPLLTGATQEIEQGAASWYGRRFHGRRTASGERYDMNALTAAHRTLPFGTVVRVRSQVTGRAVDVRINDRGPHVAGRIIDLSQAAAEALGLMGLGIKPVVLLVSAEDAAANADSAPSAELAKPPPGRSKAATRKRRTSR